MIVFIVLTLIVLNFIFVLFKLKNEKNRLIWHLIICFFPVIGPLLYLAYRKEKKIV